MSIKVIKRIFGWWCCCVAVWKGSVCQGGLCGYLHYAWQVMDWPHGQQEEPHRSTGRAQALLLYLVVKQMCHKQQDGVLQEFNAETYAFRISIVMLRDKVSLFLVNPGAVLLVWAELVWVTSSAGGNQSFSCGSDGHLKTEQKWWLTAQCVTLCSLLFAHWFCVRDWRATWFIPGGVCEEICGVAGSCTFSAGQTSDKKRACLLSLFALPLQDVWR